MPYALYPKPHFQNPRILNPTFVPSTLNPKPQTLDPRPQTLNPEPQPLNLNPKPFTPETLNP